MKKTGKRLLALALSAALLIGCAISGLVLPAAAGNVVIAGENLITNGDLSLEITGGGTKTLKDAVLSKPLEAGKRYILRFKMNGGLGQLYNSDSNIDVATEHTANLITFEAPAAGCWNEVFLFFSVNSQVEKLNNLTFYDKTNAQGVTVTYKDFAIYEYEPGMNLVPGSDGSAFPITGERAAKTAAKSFLGNFTASLATDNGNAVWKISSANQYVLIGYLKSLLENSGKQVVLSFRFKGANGGTVDPTVQAVSGITLNSTNTSSETDANGYKTFTANMTLNSSGWSGSYAYKLGFSGDTEVYVDDFYFGEYVEEPEEPATIDITKDTETVEEGSTVTLEYTATPEGTPVTWTSNDTTIARVENGVVTGEKAGTVTIIATVDGGASDACTVTVTAKPEEDDDQEDDGLNLITNGDLSLEITGGGTKTLKDAVLSKPLEAGKRYILRFKMNGGLGQLYNSDSNIDVATEHTANLITFEAPAAGCWNEVFLFFSVNSQVEKLNNLTFYDKTNAQGVTVTYKDFAIYEYEPGMNLVPGSDGSAFPITGERAAKTAAKSFLGNFTASLATDNGNAVWKISSANQYVLIGYLKSLLENSGKQVVLSFRFKGANGGTVDPTVQAVSGITLNSTNTSSETDANGYKTFTANMTLNSSGWSGSYAYKLGFSGDTEVYVDDFYFGEYVEEPEEPIENFSIEMKGTGVHFQKVEPYAIDGVRFGTKLSFGEGYRINPETGVLQLPYNNKYYDVVSMGTLLKRSSNTATELIVENVGGSGATTVWDSKAYNSDDNKLKCVEYTDSEVIFAVSMMTGSPSEDMTGDFYTRNYDARGYVQLKIDGVPKTIYTPTTLTDNVVEAVDRYNPSQS